MKKPLKAEGKPEEAGEVFLTPNRLAGLLEVQPGTIYSWISRGVNIPHIKIPGTGTLRFRQTAVMEWLLEQERARKKRNFEL